MNQFFYTAIIGDKEYLASLNINKVIRTLANDEDGLIVILDDFHEITEEIPEINTKTNKVIRYKKKTTVVQSEIILNKSDAEKFLEKFSI
jgi:hypothetical protein